jgi:transcription elongation factor Elf1
MSYTKVIEDIENLPHYREYTCRQCGHKQKAYILVVNSRCEQCGVCGKLRRYAASPEIEDVIDAVLAWLGEGEEFELAMERKRAIDSSPD